MRFCEWEGIAEAVDVSPFWRRCAVLVSVRGVWAMRLSRGNWIEEDEIANIPSFRLSCFLPKSYRKENKKPQSKKEDYFAAFLSNRALD